MADNPPLKPLHADDTLIHSKLKYFHACSTEQICLSLQAGQKDSLKVRRDGTILDGHHRIVVLRSRGVNVDALPREIIVKE